MIRYASSVAAAFAVFLCLVPFCLAQLRIAEPRPGTVCYLQDELDLHGQWNGDIPAGQLNFVWSTPEQPRLAEGLNGSTRSLAYRVERLRLEAWSGDSLVAGDSTSVTVVAHPVQFTLSEATDWEGDVSPNGQMVAYTSFRSGDPEVWIAGLDSRGATRITYQGGWDPSWTVEGRSLVFWSERSGLRDIWYVQLGQGQPAAQALTDGKGFDWMPACSPTDSRVVYCSKRGTRLSLKVLDYSQPGTVEPQEVVGPQYHPLFPRWFPGGEEILFTSYNDSLPRVCRVSLLDGQVRAVSDPGAEDADVSRDGKLVLLVKSGCLWLKRLEDGSERRLTPEGAAVLSPRFSPDGRRVIFASTLSGNYDLWLLDLPISD